MFDRTLHPTVSAQPTQRNEELLRQCPSFTAPYRLPRWLCNGHVETLFAAFFRKPLGLDYQRRLLPMSDGGTVALDSLAPEPGRAEPAADAPVLLLLPGLTGGSEGSYVQHEVRGAAAAGMRPVVMNMRGTSDQPVATAKFFSALYTDDVRSVGWRGARGVGGGEGGPPAPRRGAARGAEAAGVAAGSLLPAPGCIHDTSAPTFQGGDREAEERVPRGAAVCGGLVQRRQRPHQLPGGGGRRHAPGGWRGALQSL